MRLLALIIAVIGVIITVAFTISPIGSLTLFPALITLICGFILFRLNKLENKSTSLAKIVMGIALTCSVIAISKDLLTEDVIVQDTELKQREKESKNDAIKDLEELE